MNSPFKSVYLLAFLMVMSYFFSCSSNQDNVDQPKDKVVLVEKETKATLEGVNNDPIPFASTPTDFSQLTDPDPVLRTAIETYEADDLPGCSNALGKHFGKNDFKNLDEMLGYVVAAYEGLGLHDRSAREVLKRDRRRQVWNYAMKLDLAICLRNYALKNGLEKGIQLVNQLKKEFGNKLASPFLIVIPKGVMIKIHRGIHSNGMVASGEYRNKFHKDIPKLIERFPNDPFVDHAYYATGQPEKALAVNPKSFLKDLLTYNVGYNYIKEISAEERRLEGIARGLDIEYISDYPIFDELLVNVDWEGPEGNRINKASNLFEEYVKKFPDRPHADDAAYWLAWINAQLKRYDSAIVWMKKVREIGNKDYDEDYSLPSRLESTLSPYLTQKQLKAISISTETYDYRSEAVVINLMERMPFKEAIKLLENPQYSAYETKGLYHLVKKEYSSFQFENAMEAAKLVEAKGGAQFERISLIMQNIQQLQELEEGEVALKYSKVASGLKNYFGDRQMAFRFIDNSMNKMGQQEDLSALLYLKTIMLRNSNPHKMEAVVEQLIANYTGSKFADDALAELIYVQSMVMDQMPKAEANLEKLFSLYPSGNARDNAMNWVAMGYKRCCRGYCKDLKSKVACAKAKAYYQRIRQEFPLTRFAGYAVQNLQQL